MSRRVALRRIGSGIVSLVAAPLLAACATVSAKDRYVFEMTVQNSFKPSSMTVPRGARVVWYNISTTPHTATSDPAKARQTYEQVLPSGAQPWDSGRIYTGEWWTYTFTVPGTYVFFCRDHEVVGMVGTLIVK